MKGNGDKAWKTSKEQTKILRFMLEGPQTFNLVLKQYVTKTFLLVYLVPQSGVNKYCVFCTVKAKKANKISQ